MKKAIGVLLILLVSVIGISIGMKNQARLTGPAIPPAEASLDPERVTTPEKGSFLRLTNDQVAFYHSAAGETNARARTLDVYYSRRAYSGAPPIIPHSVEAEDERCLTCHQVGGYVPKWKAYTPVTPHPEDANCRQCHVPQNDPGAFRASTWEQSERAPLGRPWLPGSPPPVPHSLETRQKCLACHAGPGSVAEIRTTHPERSNCLQCHVPTNTSETWTRTAIES